jgi:hypothetical protein
VKVLRSLFFRFVCSMCDTISASRLVSTKTDQAQAICTVM